MADKYLLLESWGRPNVQEREWMAQTERDKESLLANDSIAVGDSVYVVESQTTYVLDFSHKWVKKTSGGGGGSARLQQKSVSITDNGDTTVTPDSGYDGLSRVSITTDVGPVLQSKNIGITANGTTTITPDSNYDGLSSVSVTTNVNPALQNKSVEVSSNGTTTVSPDIGYYGLSGINITTDVNPALQSKSMEITDNGITTIAADSGYYGISSVDIDVNVQPTLEARVLRIGGDTSKTYSILPAAGYDALSSVVITVVDPQKGDIISIDVDGDGVEEPFRIIKLNNTIAELLALYTPTVTSTSNPQGGSKVYYAYQGSSYREQVLDVYLNNTYYNTLTSEVKEAIVDKTLLDSFSWQFYPPPVSTTPSEPIYYTGVNDNGETYYLSNHEASGTDITRHVYAVGIQDILDYLGVTTSMTADNTLLTGDNLRTMFNTDLVRVWTRDEYYSGNYAHYVYASEGWVRTTGAKTRLAARPVFQIDLSKVNWQFVV